MTSPPTACVESATLCDVDSIAGIYMNAFVEGDEYFSLAAGC